MAKRFIISRNHETIDTIIADSYSDAATKFVIKKYGKKASQQRTTGVPGKSGYFQAYLKVKGGGRTSHFDPFHVVET